MSHRTKLALSLANFFDEVRNQENSEQDQDRHSRAEVSLHPDCKNQERHDVPPSAM
jgi:hypothetical protein